MRLMEWIPSNDKTMKMFVGDHHGAALGPDEIPGRKPAGETIGDWLRDRYR
jgi:hypothetical protein